MGHPQVLVWGGLRTQTQDPGTHSVPGAPGKKKRRVADLKIGHYGDVLRT